MIDELTNEQIDHVLASQVIGRIGCQSDGNVYIVPVAYVFDGTYIYAHSRKGRKIDMMRKDPRVCFQVDIIENLCNWRSVVLGGEYEELETGAQQAKAFGLLQARLGPLMTSEAAMPPKAPPPGEKKMRPIFFRIRVVEKSGRYEKR